MQLIKEFEETQTKKTPQIKPGDTVKVSQKIFEGGKQRIQVFEGVVLKVQGEGVKKTFTVRKISFGVGVERNFPLYSPNIIKIEIIKRAKVRRAVLNYLRQLKGKKGKLKAKEFDILAVNLPQEEEIAEIQTPAETQEIQSKEKEMPTGNKEVLKNKEEEKSDQELTELSSTATQDVEPEAGLEKVLKEERKEIAIEDDNPEENEALLPEEEVEAGLEKAEKEDTSGQKEDHTD